MTDEEKNLVDAYMRLIEERCRKWDARRRNEWMISLGFWSSLGFAAFNVQKMHIPVGIVTLAGITVFALYAYLIDGIRRRSHEDSYYTRRLTREAEAMVSGAPITPRADPAAIITWGDWWKSLRGNYSFRFQIATTAALVALVIAIATAPKTPSDLLSASVADVRV